MADDRIIVTGCSGFVGKHVVQHFISKGHHVIGLSRTDPQIAGLEFRHFDVTDSQNFLTDEFNEATIINTAALTGEDGSQSAYEKTNYWAVLNLLRLNPQGKFIHISSSSIYNLDKASVEVTENDFRIDQYEFYNGYSFYKAKAEHAILKKWIDRDVQPISLRPHAVYGIGDTTLMPKLRERVKLQHLFLPNGGLVKHSLTHVSNLVHGIDCALTYTSEQPEAFNITDANAVTVAQAVRSALGENLTINSVPTKILLGKLGKLLKVSPYEIRQLGMERTYDLSKAKTLLGYNPSNFNVDSLT